MDSVALLSKRSAVDGTTRNGDGVVWLRMLSDVTRVGAGEQG